MLLGKPLRPETSRSGSASPEPRNAESSRDAWTTDFTRYGSRGVSLSIKQACHPTPHSRRARGLSAKVLSRTNPIGAQPCVSHSKTPHCRRRRQEGCLARLSRGAFERESEGVHVAVNRRRVHLAVARPEAIWNDR